MLKDRKASLWDRLQLRRRILLSAGLAETEVDDHIAAWLPQNYPKGACMYFPRLDYRYIRAVTYAVRGGVFLDGGSLHNSKNSQRRLARKPGLIRDATKGETDEHD